MRFRSFPALVPLVLVLALLSTGCAPALPPVNPTPVATAIVSASPAQAANFPVTVKDDADRTITFDRLPQRIVSLTPGHTETLYALGAGDRVVVTDKYSDFPPENKPKATLDTYPKPNAEELVSLKPDLIVVLVEGDEFIQQMEPRGIKVLKLFPKTFDGALGDIELLGRVTATESRARQITDEMRERAAAVVAKTKNAPKPRVLYELDASEPARPFVAGPAGFFGGLVPMAGGQNVFDDIGKPSGQVSTEQIVARDPEIIIMGDADSPFNAQTPDMVRTRPGWQTIAAVRTGRIHPLDQAFLSRPGPRLADGLERMAKIIHPELFP
ncbi:MAG TPA: ABC transporter substrate-binding protein [Chloroflexota bacterium]|jgi:iron complex transport system substrate-binding protein|nr:ABC transporter substrate-binding protein [Chloroflexota bacterium]